MELIFIRHGQGEHTLNLSASLKLQNPSLTGTEISPSSNRWPRIMTKESYTLIEGLKKNPSTFSTLSKKWRGFFII